MQSQLTTLPNPQQKRKMKELALCISKHFFGIQIWCNQTVPKIQCKDMKSWIDDESNDKYSQRTCSDGGFNVFKINTL